MPIDLGVLKTEIEAGPLATELASLKTEGQHNAIADVLNRRDLPGYVPITELAAYCCKEHITGAVMALLEIPIGTDIAPGVPMDVPTKAMLHTVMTLVQLDFRLTEADVTDPAFVAACDGLIALQAMTAEQKAGVLALGANRASRATGLFGQAVTTADVSAALALE